MNDSRERDYYLDAMRSVLMMLGVVLHASVIYDASRTWQLNSDETARIATWIVSFIGLFRMPAFFLIAGYFCGVLLQKYSIRQYLATRTSRILIPVVSTVLTLNVLQYGIRVYYDIVPFDIIHHLKIGDWIQHLWFLINLFYYVLLSAILVYWVKPQLRILRDWSHRYLNQIPTVLLFTLLPLASIAMYAIGRVFDFSSMTHYGLVNGWNFVTYIPFFTVGAILSVNKPLLLRWSSINPFFLIVSFFTIVWFSHVYPLPQVVQLFFNYLLTWLTIAGCFYLFYRFCNTRSKFWNFLSDASYTVYLFHNIIVILFGMVLIKLDIPPVTSIMIIMIATTAVCLYIHARWIQPFSTTRWLFNGK